MSEASLIEEAPETTVDAPESDSLPACEKCGVPSDAAACPACGWYPSLGIHVEIDESFERVMGNVPAASEETAADEPAKPEWQKHLEVWRGVIPGWGWLMLATTGGIVAAAIAARVVTLASPSMQTIVGVSGLFAGIGIAVLAHLVGFVLCSFDNADFGVADVLIKPLKTWKLIASGLPERLWLANSANVGLTTALASALIVGGIPYEKLLDWGFKARAKQSLVAMIAEKAGEAPGNGSDNLEDAMGDFAGKAASDLEGAAAPTPPAPKPRQNLECLILGYQTNRDGQLSYVLLASEHYGKLKYVGRVKPTLPGGELVQLLQRFEDNVQPRPMVKTLESGTYVRPRFMCKVSCAEWERGKRPKDLQWGELLDEIKLPW